MKKNKENQPMTSVEMGELAMEISHLIHERTNSNGEAEMVAGLVFVTQTQAGVLGLVRMMREQE